MSYPIKKFLENHKEELKKTKEANIGPRPEKYLYNMSLK